MARAIQITTQLQYAEQELAMYRAAVPGMIEAGHFTKESGALRIACAEAVVESLRMLMPPAGAEQVTRPVVVHFRNERERADFIKAYGAKK